jgi:hypothetical protein
VYGEKWLLVETLFWEDPWVDGGALKDSYGRLYIVAKERKIKVN